MIESETIIIGTLIQRIIDYNVQQCIVRYQKYSLNLIQQGIL